METLKDMLGRLVEEEEKRILSSMLDSECMTTVETKTFNNLDAFKFKEAIEIIKQSYVDYAQSYLVSKGTMMIMYHEKIRESNKYHTKRGKTILINPCEIELIKAFHELNIPNFKEPKED